MSEHITLDFGVTLEAYRKTLGKEAAQLFDAALAEAGSQAVPGQILAIYRDKFIQAHLQSYQPILDRAKRQKILLAG